MIDQALRTLVRRRANHRCEYCRLHQDDADIFAFHIEHIIAKQHGGMEHADNLCLACADAIGQTGPT